MHSKSTKREGKVLKKDSVKPKKMKVVQKKSLVQASQLAEIDLSLDKNSKRQRKIGKKDQVKLKKRKLGEKKVLAGSFQVDNVASEDEFIRDEKLIEVKVEKKKKNYSGKKKSKKVKDSPEEIFKASQLVSEGSTVATESSGYDIPTRPDSSTGPQQLNNMEIRDNKSKNSRKMKKKDHFSSTTDGKPTEKSASVASKLYSLSSGDDDSSKGMKKWITEYHQSRPGLMILQERIDEFITAHEEQEEQARKEREDRVAEGGWTVVTHQKGRKKTTDAESGITVGSVAQAAVVDKMAKKKSKEVGMDFYRFQRREANRSEVMMLQSKFEQDKKRIQQLRAARKFRPY